MKVTQCDMTWAEFEKTYEARDIVGTWLNIPSEGGWTLVGHINKMGGLCNDCPVHPDAEIVAYAIPEIDDLARWQRELPL